MALNILLYINIYKILKMVLIQQEKIVNTAN